VTALYTIILLTALIGMASLGVDYARVQLAKTELQRGADAAARYAALTLSSGTATARSNAVACAAQNTVDGQPLVLDPNLDVEFGTWTASTKTFTPSAGSNVDSVRISAHRTAARGNAIALTMAAVIGRSTCDVNVVSIAKVKSGFGLIGLDSIDVSGNGNTDSYNSVNGLYSAALARDGGHVASNGNITMSGSGIVHGDAHPGVGKSVLLSGGASVTGTTTPMTQTLSFPAPTLPTSYFSVGAFSVSSGTFYVAAGDYYCTSLSVSNNATFYCQGPVRVFCSGPVNISGGSINTYQNVPANMQILMLNSSSVTLSGQADLYATIYAPLSPVYQSGRADIYGSIVGKSLSFSGTWDGGVHFDESLGTGGTTISLVK
jgi:Flp pilus assembly protein TadG